MDSEDSKIKCMNKYNTELQVKNKKSFQNYDAISAQEELRDAKNIATQSTTTIADIRNQRNSKVKHIRQIIVHVASARK